MQIPDLKTAVREIYAALKAQGDDLRPSPRLDALFEQLTELATSHSGQSHDLTPAEIEELQDICCRGTFQLERHWAEKILALPETGSIFESIPYIAEYRALTKFEWQALKSCAEHGDHNVLFCGGGPLPLTAMLLAREYGVPTTVIDYDAEAVRLSRQVVAKFGLAQMVTIVQADARDYEGYSRHNVIFVAAMAGMESAVKEAIFERISREVPEGSHILARSSRGNRMLLDRPLPAAAYENFSPLLEIHPYGSVVNSVILFQKKTISG